MYVAVNVPANTVAVCVPATDIIVAVCALAAETVVAVCEAPTVRTRVVVLLTTIAQLFVFNVAEMSVITDTSEPDETKVIVCVLLGGMYVITDVLAVPRSVMVCVAVANTAVCVPI